MDSDEATLVGEYEWHVQVESSPVLSVPFDTDQGCARCADADVQARIKEVRSSTLSPCAILLSEVGKHYHTFPKGTFPARFTPLAIPLSLPTPCCSPCHLILDD